MFFICGGVILILNLIIIIIIIIIVMTKKTIQPDMWVGLDSCDALGWVGLDFFNSPHDPT